ncbi:hypothetical protein HY572_01485 [Candidatus Micrarchaeota archaeon]|nr:hypothetical protein [Candidatus Micrarchaeota archaeon]
MPARLVDRIQDILLRHHAPAEVSGIGPRFFVSVRPEYTLPKQSGVSPADSRLVVEITNVETLSPAARKEINTAFQQYVARRRQAQRADFGGSENRPRIRIVFSRRQKNQFRLFDSATVVRRLERHFQRVFSFHRRGSY